MKKIYSLVLIIICTFSQVIFSQNDFVSGYIITNDQDTIHGEISHQSNIQNSRICRFRKAENQEVKEYNPFDIVGFRFINGQFYISMEIKQNEEVHKVFLEYLLDGVVDLFYLKKEYGDESFFIERDGELNELTNEEKKVIDEQGNTYQKKTGKYKGALNYIFRDNPTYLKKKINGVTYNSKSLIRFTEDYNNIVCNEYECINYTKSTKGKWLFEFYGGVDFGTMSIKTGKTKAKSIIPTLGFNFRYIPKGSDPAWNCIVGLEYSSYKYDEYIDHNLKFYEYPDNGTDLNYTTINIPVEVEYSFPTGKLRPFITLGIKPMFAIDQNIRWYYYNYDYKVWDPDALEDVYYGWRKVDTDTDTDGRDFGVFHYEVSSGLGIKYMSDKNKYYYIKGEYGLQDVFKNDPYKFTYYMYFRTIGVKFGMAF